MGFFVEQGHTVEFPVDDIGPEVSHFDGDDVVSIISVESGKGVAFIADLFEEVVGESCAAAEHEINVDVSIIDERLTEIKDNRFDNHK